MTYEERCRLAQSLLPESSYRDRLTTLHSDMLAEIERSLELYGALQSLTAVARRYLPDYDEHPEIQRADEALGETQ
jgi:hypothetical protein